MPPSTHLAHLSLPSPYHRLWRLCPLTISSHPRRTSLSPWPVHVPPSLRVQLRYPHFFWPLCVLQPLSDLTHSSPASYTLVQWCELQKDTASSSRPPAGPSIMLGTLHIKHVYVIDCQGHPVLIFYILYY